MMAFDPVSDGDTLRLGVFLALLAVLAIAERAWPCRGDAALRPRQATNLALMLLDTALVRVLFPFLAVAWAQQVSAQSFGLLPLLGLPSWAALVLAFLLLDLAIYWQHRLFHRLPLLWRLHRVHHCDIAFDVSLAVRFHPLEVVASMLIKFAVIAAIGAPAWAVLAFEIALSAGSLFTHADLRLPAAVERRLRWLLVTPDLHRVHHSVRRVETDSNFGFHLSCWDRLFGSFCSRPAQPQETMPIGLSQFRAPREQGLLALLGNPFRNTPPMTPTDPPDA